MAKIEIDMDLGAFLTELGLADKEKLPFHETMAAALFHAATMRKTDEFFSRISDDTGCGVILVARYAKGLSAPMPTICKLVLKRTHAVLTDLADEHRRERKEAHAAFRRLNLAVNMIGVEETRKRKEEEKKKSPENIDKEREEIVDRNPETD